MTSGKKKKNKGVKKKEKRTADPNQGYFFDEPPQYVDEDPTFKPYEYPVWTRNKARLVQRYLRYFVFITRHGTYIDGFAGPQEPDRPETWTRDWYLRANQNGSATSFSASSTRSKSRPCYHYNKEPAS